MYVGINKGFSILNICHSSYPLSAIFILQREMDALMQRHRFVVRHRRRERRPNIDIDGLWDGNRDSEDGVKRQVRHERITIEGDTLR